MANVMIKSDEQRRHEEYVLKTFGRSGSQGQAPTKEQREAAEIISRRAAEAAKKYVNK